MRTTDPRAVLLVALLVVSGGGLVVLGLSASGAAEARAELRSRRLLEGAAAAIADGVATFLRDADDAADAWKPETELDPLLTHVFVMDADGSLRHPALSSFPALPPPEEDEVARVRTYLRESRELQLAAAETLLQTAAFEEFRHPDLVGVLLLALADRSVAEGNRDRAAYRYRSIIDDIPAARDLAGEAIAPTAHLRLLAELDALGRTEERAAAIDEFARRLADRAWDLPLIERDLMLERLAGEFPDARLPAGVAARREFVDAFRPQVSVLATLALAPGSAPAGWSRRALRQHGALELFGWRSLRLDGEPHVFGYRVARPALDRRLLEIAQAVARRFQARVEMETSPPISVGIDPGADPLATTVDLPAGLDAIPAAVGVERPTDLGGLRALHLAMTALLFASLVAGIGISIRALRRELATARIRQNLLDNTSHELRTPLTAIRMYSEMLNEEELPEEKRAEYLGLVHSEAERLSRLVDDVLDLSRLGRDRDAPEGVLISPRELATAAIERWPGADVSMSVAEDLPPVTADTDSAVRVLLNLLDNARKYSGGDIRLEGHRADGAVELHVVDTGPGIPEAEREQLFTRFYRSPRDARKVRGVGLGLVLAREIAAAFGGDVRLVETSPEGSRFALRLPLHRGEGTT